MADQDKEIASTPEAADPVQEVQETVSPPTVDSPVTETASAETPLTGDDKPIAAFIQPTIKKQSIGEIPANEPLIVPVDKDAGHPLVVMPSTTAEGMEAAKEHVPVDMEIDVRWAAIQSASEQTSTDGEYEGALSEEGAKWSRIVRTLAGTRVGSMNLTAPNSAGREVVGSAAVMAFKTYQTGSAGVRIMFYGSGFAVKFKNLENSALYDISHELGESRITAGRSSYGMALSQHMTFSAEVFLEAARAARFNSTLKDNVDIGDALRVTDYQSLVWGLTYATWPQGYDILRGCCASPDTCDHIVHEHINVGRCQHAKTGVLSPEQTSWLDTMTDNTQSLETLAGYQSMFQRIPTNVYEYTKSNGQKYTFVLKVPTLNETIGAGKKWINEISGVVARTLGQQATFNDRNKAFAERMDIATARQYSHWVESITFNNTIVRHEETIGELLSGPISSDDELMPFFIESVRDFNEKSTAGLILISNYKCPGCGKWQIVEEGQDPEGESAPIYQPIDSTQTFTTLMSQKLRD